MEATKSLLKISVEQTPKKIKRGVSEVILNRANQITITHLPGSRLKDTTAAAKALINKHGAQPSRVVPHIGARNIASKTELTRQINNFEAMGITNVLVVGGSSNNPQGPYAQDDEILKILKKKGFSVGCGVYPYEQGIGYYTNSDKLTRYDFGVSQLCLSPKILRPLPDNVWIGAPSRATISGLWGYMKRVGVGPSISYPFRDLGGLIRFSSFSGFRTNAFVQANVQTHNQFHIYDFGGLEQTLEGLSSFE